MAKGKTATKRVVMRRVSASPDGVFPVGATREVSTDTAAHLIDTGQADPLASSVTEGEFSSTGSSGSSGGGGESS